MLPTAKVQLLFILTLAGLGFGAYAGMFLDTSPKERTIWAVGMAFLAALFFYTRKRAVDRQRRQPVPPRVRTSPGLRVRVPLPPLPQLPPFPETEPTALHREESISVSASFSSFGNNPPRVFRATRTATTRGTPFYEGQLLTSESLSPEALHAALQSGILREMELPSHCRELIQRFVNSRNRHANSEARLINEVLREYGLQPEPIKKAPEPQPKTWQERLDSDEFQ